MEKLMELLKQEGMVRKVAREINVTTAVVYGWKSGTYIPNRKNRKLLNEKFGCDFFIGKSK